jgi:aspartate 1-decarboxylase
MPGNPHPASLVYPNGSDVSKADVIGDDKLKVRRLGTADDIRNGDWSGQYGLLFVAAKDSFYKLDTSDTTSLDDDDAVIRDANGLRFKKYTIATTLTTRTHSAAGAVTVTADDVDVIFVNKTVGEATTVNLPPAANRTKAVRIVDAKGDAGTNNITVEGNAAETVMGAANYVIDFNHGSITLTPLPNGSGWY